ncbi:protein of unknown function [Bradyrhizobium sp. ORS 285]|nr:protein of unknown function [Bradyrhizobium sp. ORS 285]
MGCRDRGGRIFRGVRSAEFCRLRPWRQRDFACHGGEWESDERELMSCVGFPAVLEQLGWLAWLLLVCCQGVLSFNVESKRWSFELVNSLTDNRAEWFSMSLWNEFIESDAGPSLAVSGAVVAASMRGSL